jgi:uncharacterized membrane protein
MTLAIHVSVAVLGLLSGYVALYSAKGATLHRKSGIVFVYAMLAMSLLGMVIAVTRNVALAVNIPAGVFTSYLVITGLTTVRPLAARGRWLDRGALLVATVLATTNLTFAVQAFANGGKRNGIPAFPFVMLGVVASLAAIGDVRMLRSGPLQGGSRLARHLWRMCFALFLASLALPKVIPQPYRSRTLVALPVLAVLVTMFYWLWRVRASRSSRRVLEVSIEVSAPDSAVLKAS